MRPESEDDGSRRKTFQKAVFLHQQGNLIEAEKLYHEIIGADPGHFESNHLLGLAAFSRKNIDEAEAWFARAIALNPGHAPVYYNYGVMLQELKRTAGALESYRNSIIRNPAYAEAYQNCAVIFQETKRFKEAIDHHEKVIAINQGHALGHFSYGVTLHRVKQFERAILKYDKALSLRPDYAHAYHNRSVALRELMRFEEAMNNAAMAVRCDQNYFDAYNNLFFTASYLTNPDRLSVSGSLRAFGSSVSKAAKFNYSTWNSTASPDQLRIGFVSGDLRSHSVAFFLENVISSLSQSSLFLIAYSNNSDEDHVTSRFKALFSEYRSLVGLSDEEAAALIHADGVQILIDLSGHTALNRLPVFAYKPAPVQFSWLGYWATTGVEEMDFVLGDAFVAPPEEASHFSEKIKRLPECYICFTQPEEDVDVNDLPALQNGYITFGCFNNFSKVNEAVMALWAKILLAVEGSRLFLRAEQLADPNFISSTVAFFASRGIPQERLSFEGTSTIRRYLEAYNKIDIALDPFPFPGVTTSVQSLWMGVPVLTKKGDRFVSHAGETIAHNSGLKDWIAQDDADYLAKAVHFSSNVQSLARLRSCLRGQVLASPLFDSERFARHFEDALFEMWEEYKHR